MTEFELIDHLRNRLGLRNPQTQLGIGDDAALLRVNQGSIAAAVDTLVAGVHFPAGTAAADLGWKSLAVNLSDLAAMAATPRWALLALTVPEVDKSWIDDFADGWAALACTNGIELIGGDTTRGPLTISVTVLGEVDGQPLLRSAANAGDDLYVSGNLGEAAAGLALLQQRLNASGSATDRAQLVARLNRPQPRCGLGLALGLHASAAIDVSDGLLSDAAHLLRASGLAATLDLGQLQPSPALAAVIADPNAQQHCMLNGGDDYELLFTAPPGSAADIARVAADTGTKVCRIGRVHQGTPGLIYAAGSDQPLVAQGWDHFR